MKVLITGANGFVGRVIAAELAARAHELVLIDRPGFPGDDADLPEGAQGLGVDITSPADMERLEIDRVDSFIHAAGLAHQFGPVTREAFWKVNVDGTENSAKLAARLGGKHFILISSVSVYGSARDGVSLRTEDAAGRPEGLYAESKLESESAARKICEENGIDLTILRLATVIGEGDAGNVFRLIRSIDRKRFLWIGKGENKKSLVYKTDVARACAAVLVNKAPGTEIFNVSATPGSMKAIVAAIEEALGKKTLPISISPGLLKTGFKLNAATLGIKKIARVGQTVEKWLSDETFSSDKIEKVYGFRAETGIEEAILREVDWYLKNK